MPALVQLIAAPVLVVVAALLIRSIPLLSKLAALLLWWQVVSVASLLSPVLFFGADKVTIMPEFCVNRLAAMFVLLTQIVVAAAVTHAHVFFEKDVAELGNDPKYVRAFYVCTGFFLIALTSVYFCDNLGFLWISVEATTLSSAPLVYYHGTKHSLEAAWKYLMICSVGIAFALLGTMLVFASSQYGAIASGGSLNLSVLTDHAPLLQYPLLRLGFLFCLLGYGTKAGIFPLHSWLPDAHSEAPAPASAMLSGALLNCALFAIWRLAQLVTASGHEPLVRQSATTAAGITVVAASIFLIRQHGLKRLFAYSSIENVGLMLAAIGLGVGPLFFILALNHSVAKSAVFLICGNIIQSTGTKNLTQIRGLLAASPQWAGVLIVAAIAVTGSPPFGAFIAEWQLLTKCSQLHLWPLLGALLCGLTVSFLAVMSHVGKIVAGNAREKIGKWNNFTSTIVPAGLMLVALLAGITNFTNFMW